MNPQFGFYSHDKMEGVAVLDHGTQVVISNDSDFGIMAADFANGKTPPYTLEEKLSPVTGEEDNGEYLAVDMNRVTASHARTLEADSKPTARRANIHLDPMTPLTADRAQTRAELGLGIYSLADLRTYLACYADEASVGAMALTWLADALNPVDGHVARRPDYAFSDLISLFVVRELRRLGVGPSKIRQAEQHMRQTTGLERPFMHREVMTDGRDVWIVGDEPEQVEAASGPRGQQASRSALEAYLESVQYADDIAATWIPAEHVVVNPGIQFGEPVVQGTRVPTSAVADIAESAGPELAAARLGIRPAEATAAIAFERKLAALRN